MTTLIIFPLKQAKKFSVKYRFWLKVNVNQNRDHLDADFFRTETIKWWLNEDLCMFVVFAVTITGSGTRFVAQKNKERMRKIGHYYQRYQQIIKFEDFKLKVPTPFITGNIIIS